TPKGHTFISRTASLLGTALQTDPFRVQDANTQALLCLARRRADVLFAMLRDGTFYEPQPAVVR
ncbi:IS110 family transposase, partial [Streptomyces sp. NPDC056696]